MPRAALIWVPILRDNSFAISEELNNDLLLALMLARSLAHLASCHQERRFCAFVANAFFYPNMHEKRLDVLAESAQRRCVRFTL